MTSMQNIATVSDTPDGAAVPEHVAIIMDGNGRWAERRGLPRSAGHKKGVDAVRAAVRHAGDLGIKTLTLFSFSSENWRRPATEVNYLMGLLKTFIRRDLADLHKEGVKLCMIGSREGLPSDILPLIEEAERVTKDNTKTRLVIAFNYGGRDEIVRATKALISQIDAGTLCPDELTVDSISGALDTHGWCDPDLVIRTSGEKRLSNFMLWQAAYSEFVFSDCLWPDFDKNQFNDALNEFTSRSRRFGGVSSKKAAQ